MLLKDLAVIFNLIKIINKFKYRKILIKFKDPDDNLLTNLMSKLMDLNLFSKIIKILLLFNR